MTWDPQQPGAGRPPEGQGAPPPQPYPTAPPPLPNAQASYGGGYYAPGQAPPQGYYGGPAGPYGAPLVYGQYAAPRPTSATVLAIIGLVLGGIAILNHGLGLLLIASDSAFATEPGWPRVDSTISMIVWLVGVIGCIGLLRLNAGSRRMMLGWAGVYILWLIVCGAVAVTHTIPEVIAQSGANRPPGFEQGAYGGAVCALVFFAAYPIVVLSMLSRPHVVAAYDGVGRL